MTALMHAAAHGHVEAVRMLLEAGADASSRDPTGKTARRIAEERNDEIGKEIAKLLRVREKKGFLAWIRWSSAPQIRIGGGKQGAGRLWKIFKNVARMLGLGGMLAAVAVSGAIGSLDSLLVAH